MTYPEDISRDYLASSTRSNNVKHPPDTPPMRWQLLLQEMQHIYSECASPSIYLSICLSISLSRYPFPSFYSSILLFFWTPSLLLSLTLYRHNWRQLFNDVRIFSSPRPPQNRERGKRDVNGQAGGVSYGHVCTFLGRSVVSRYLCCSWSNSKQHSIS